ALDGRYRYVCWADYRSGNWDIYASVTLYNNPTLVASPPGLSFSMERGKTAPGTQSLIINHTGYNKLSFVVHSSAPWLSVSPASGTTTDPVQVSVSDTLGEGSFAGKLTLMDITNNDSSASVPVYFTVTSPRNDTPRIGSGHVSVGSSCALP